MRKEGVVVLVVVLVVAAFFIGYNLRSGEAIAYDSFAVAYTGGYSSGGGDRALDIVYYVQGGEIVSCDGTYSYPPSAAQQEAGQAGNNVEDCDVNKLKNLEYPIDQFILLVSSGDDLEGSSREGSSYNSWSIIFPDY